MAEAQRLEGLGLMAGGIAHDFNNLLVGVLANADLALRNLSDPSVARGFIERVKLAAERLAGFARQMLSYTGRDHVRITQIDLARVTRETLGLIASNIPAHVHVEAALPTNLPAVDGDTAQLSQIVVNLVINAAEAIGDRPGTVRVSLRKEFLDNDRTASLAVRSARGAMECLCLEVSDDGAGMDLATRNRIFDPFFTTKQQAGRGLGLASVMGVVRAHQGSLRVDSEPGVGTTMRVWLPLSTERVRATTLPPGSNRPEARGRSVLVVDDEPIVRETTGAVLRSYGFQIHYAVDGADAVASAERLPQVDLILLDMNMPGMSVQKCYAALREVLPETGILLTSGYNDPSVLEHLLTQPATGFIQKPYAIEDLLQHCAVLLG
jgi:CheY-like chemotaxis protein/two-component sensor histidine kinase